MSQKIIIDTDAGDDIDDVLALAFAVLRPELSVEAITTVTAGAERRARLVKELLAAAGRENVLVAAGCERPLHEIDAKATSPMPYRFSHFPEVDDESVAVDTDAVDLIIRTVEDNPGEVAIACIGPLTNVGAALRLRPDLAGKIPWIAFMGGEVAVNRVEHNIVCDPQAAAVVFTSGAPLFMGGWEVTRRFFLSPEDCAAIREKDTPLCRKLSHWIDQWWPGKGWKPGPVMYDIAPIVWSFDRSLYPTKAMNVQVETKGEFTTGMTVARGGDPNMEVAVDIQAEAVRNLYLETLIGKSG